MTTTEVANSDHIFAYMQCQEAQNAFFSALLKKPNEMAIIGPTCSSVSDSIAQIAHHYQIPMVQCHSNYVSIPVTFITALYVSPDVTGPLSF